MKITISFDEGRSVVFEKLDPLRHHGSNCLIDMHGWPDTDEEGLPTKAESLAVQRFWCRVSRSFEGLLRTWNPSIWDELDVIKKEELA